MRNSHQIYWGQGQFLTPQHFQQQDLFHLGQLHERWRLASPLGWGVVSLRIEEGALADQRLDIAHCQLLTQEGLWLEGGLSHHHASARSVWGRSFRGLLDPGGAPLGVYLGVPRHQVGQSNAASAGDPVAPAALPMRYCVSMSEEGCPDLFHMDRPSATVSYVQPNLVIVFDREDGFETTSHALDLIKIAELLPRPDGLGAQLSTVYVPPCLRISSVPNLFTWMRDLRDLLTGQAREFETLRRHRQDHSRLQLTQTLGRYVPQLHHMCEMGHAHPEQAYALIRQMLGEFSVFTEEVGFLGSMRRQSPELADDLPCYNHQQLAACFSLALTRLSDIIRKLNTGDDAGIPLVREGRFYHAPLPASLFAVEGMRYYLSIDSKLSGDELRRRLQKTGKVSAMEDMEELLSMALSGLTLDLITHPPEDLPARAGRTFFRIDSVHPSWTRVRELRNIAVFCDLELAHTSMRLHATGNADV